MRKELNKRLIKQEEKIRKPEPLFENLKYESNKNSSRLKTVLIWILFFFMYYFIFRWQKNRTKSLNRSYDSCYR